MIERAVFSYFNPDQTYFNKCGFARFSDFLYTTALAVHLASKHFKEVVMVSSTWGNKMFRDMKFPVTAYSNRIDEARLVSKWFWAYGKLLAYVDQDKPFVHLDNDVFLWDPLPQRILNAELCFQSHEPMNLFGYLYYDLLKKTWVDAPMRPWKIEQNEVKDFAYNCGICGGHNLPFFKEWIECSKQYIFAPQNQEVFFVKHRPDLVHQNIFHEQYFAACLIKMHDLREKVQVIHPDITYIPQVMRYTHLWGTVKRSPGKMRLVIKNLQKENKPLFLRVRDYCQSHKTELK